MVDNATRSYSKMAKDSSVGIMRLTKRVNDVFSRLNHIRKGVVGMRLCIFFNFVLQ